MAVPQVVIVGRPNVGKSSLFNWLAHKRLAIVDQTAGVTRDRLTYLLCEDDRFFEIVDTGGMGFDDPDNLNEAVESQIDAALESAAVILFVVDTRTGLTPADYDVAKRLRYIDVPTILVANKTDDDTYDTQADEFYKLGRGKLIRVSTLQNRNRRELLSMIVQRLPEPTAGDGQPADVDMKLAIVGRRNVGKSTFINTLAQAERVIVSEIAGTTRDSIDVRFELDGKTFVAIDTPGLRRRKSVTTDIDFYSKHRAERSIRRADIVFLFFDPMQPISKVDKQLCDYIEENYKPCIFVVNKWDLLHGELPTEKWVTYLRDTFRSMHHVPIAFITGKTGKNMKALINHAQMLFKQTQARVSTGELNRVIKAALKQNPPPIVKNKRLKIYYATQVDAAPPTIVLFCNDPLAIMPTYRRYLLGVFRDNLPFGEVPIKLYLRRREERTYSAADLMQPELREMISEEEPELLDDSLDDVLAEDVLGEDYNDELEESPSGISRG
ncbi:MAG: ribosome biogenesis GTPase Der [Pirellulales bacterium]|nr:ribosome biogenesis GTPase Der [Pirellulales bacterium]